jgi:serine/threonine protein kinase
LTRARRFLAKACAGDEELRREVESLLAQDASADAVLTRGAVVAAAGLVSDVGGSVLTGRRLGAYQILSPLGAGGMGEVYRARDTRLGRDVAIKILPRAFTADADRLARFEREARVLASLNHPHIAAIYGFEEGPVEARRPAEANPTYAMLHAARQSAHSRTRRRRNSRGADHARRIQRAPLKETLDIARQIADALDAATRKASSTGSEAREHQNHSAGCRKSARFRPRRNSRSTNRVGTSRRRRPSRSTIRAKD